MRISPKHLRVIVICGLVIAFITIILHIRRQDTSLSPGARRAVAAAKEEARRRGWMSVEVSNPDLVGGRWELAIWSLPRTPGNHAFVAVSSNGVVLRFTPGL